MKTSGFTLLEVLVVLVITGLISVVLIQGLGLVLGVRSSVAGKILDIDRVVLHRNLVLEPLRGIVPDYPDKSYIFSGNTRELHALTVRPLRERFGTPTGMDLTLKYEGDRNETLVMYREDGQEEAIELMSWPGNSGAFTFRDRSGNWLERWPIIGEEGPSAQTPWQIRLDTGTQQAATIIAAIAGSHRRTLRIQDFPGSAPNNN
jgi:general secretion pathway protein J